MILCVLTNNEGSLKKPHNKVRFIFWEFNYWIMHSNKVKSNLFCLNVFYILYFNIFKIHKQYQTILIVMFMNIHNIMR